MKQQEPRQPPGFLLCNRKDKIVNREQVERAVNINDPVDLVMLADWYEQNGIPGAANDARFLLSRQDGTWKTVLWWGRGNTFWYAHSMLRMVDWQFLNTKGTPIELIPPGSQGGVHRISPSDLRCLFLELAEIRNSDLLLREWKKRIAELRVAG